MNKFIKNFPFETVVNLAGEIQVRSGEISSKTLTQNKYVSITLFAFDKGEEIGSHDSEGDAMVICLEGKGKCIVGGKEHILNAGESLIMPSKIQHSVHAIEEFKMMLIVVFPEK